MGEQIQTMLYSGRDTPSSDSDQEQQAVGIANSVNKVVKRQQMYAWNHQYEKWHECEVSLRPPHLYITEHEDTRIEIQDKQLQHHHERWFHGSISRREAKNILLDYAGGDGSFLVRSSESFFGKFAISFIHEGRVKHVVIETKPDQVVGMVYHITSQGPFFNSVTELIEEAQRKCIIQNSSFNVILTRPPPMPNQGWLHKNVKTLSQAEKIMSKHQKDGAFFVYETLSSFAPYSLVYRNNGCVTHAPIMVGPRSSHNLNLYGVSAPVLYKLIHYYMENPIEDDLTLKYPIHYQDTLSSNCAIACCDTIGDRLKNELSFCKGSLITNISRRSSEWCVGDHRGDRNKFFPTSAVRFLTNDELGYVKAMKMGLQQMMTDDSSTSSNEESTHCLNLQTDYTVSFNNEDSLIITITPTDQSSQLPSFKLSCMNGFDLIQWYETLEEYHCLPRRSSNPINQANNGSHNKKRKGRKKRGSCVIS